MPSQMLYMSIFKLLYRLNEDLSISLQLLYLRVSYSVTKCVCVCVVFFFFIHSISYCHHKHKHQESKFHDPFCRQNERALCCKCKRDQSCWKLRIRTVFCELVTANPHEQKWNRMPICTRITKAFDNVTISLVHISSLLFYMFSLSACRCDSLSLSLSFLNIHLML